MSWDSVLAGIKFFRDVNLDPWGDLSANSGTPFTSTEQDILVNYIHDLYLGSQEAELLLEAGTSNGHEIRLFQTRPGDPGRGVPYQGIAGFNLSAINAFYYFDSSGWFVQEISQITVIHELFHAILGTTDLVGSDLNSASFDHDGETLRKQNIVAGQMGYENNIQVSYLSGILDSNPKFSLLRQDISYSENNAIDIVRFGTTEDSNDNLDSSNRTDGSRDVIIGFGGMDEIYGGGGADYLYGGGGKDTIFGGSGADVIHGGDRKLSFAQDGDDTTDYSVGDNHASPTHGVTVEIDPAAVSEIDKLDGNDPIIVSDDGFDSRDRLFSIENIKLSSHNDIVKVGSGADDLLSRLKEVDAGSQDEGGRDELDLSQMGEGVIFEKNKIKGFDTKFEHFETLKLTSHDDVIKGADLGTLIYTGNGHDDVQIGGGGSGIADLSPEDRITIAGELEFHGGVRYLWSESQWATSYGGLFKTGTNHDGELVVEVDGLGTVYVLNWAGSGGMDVPLEQRPGQISVYEYDAGAYRLIDPNKPSNMTQEGMWQLMGAIVQATFGVKIWQSNDPLTLDLDGDGLELTYRTSISPLFDVDGDGYAERTGWVAPDDGLLVRDLNGNGKIDDSTEMFGGAHSGFDALAELDGNQDNKIDANDNGLADFNGDGVIDSNDTINALVVWRDLDQDAVTDAGELFSLADLNIASISLDNQTQTNVSINGNRVASTASFVRTDGSTGTIADIWYSLDNIETQYTGGPITITAEAAQLPEHRGYGTLVSLREAMSLVPAFATTVQNTLPAMSSLDLDDLRQEALPILTGWALASPLSDGDRDPNTQPTLLRPHQDMHVLVQDGAFGRDEVIDFAYQTTATVLDENNQPQTITYWALASGDDVTDANGAVIDYPTLEQVLASPQTGGTWSTFSGALIAFAERYIGESLPLDMQMPAGTGPITGFTELFTSVLNTIDLAVVRIAVQGGPLSPYFSGIAYDAENNIFHAAPGNDRNLIPVFEAIFDEAKATSADAAWIGEWKPILDIVIGDYVRGEEFLLNTYAFLAQNIVAAYEESGLTLGFAAVSSELGIPQDLLVTGTGTLSGSNDADIFYAVGGNDTLQGGEGPDTYIFGQAIGHDVIDDVEAAGSGNQVPDTIRFAALAPEDIIARRDGIDLILTVAATGETIAVTGQFSGRAPGLFGGNLVPDQGVGEIIFADGTVWDALDIAKAVKEPKPTSDTVTGTGAIDYLDGGTGDDILIGGDEGDHYFFDAGYGHDAVQDQQSNVLLDGPDFIIFGPGVDYGDVIFSRDGNSSDLEISLAGNGADSLTVAGQFDAAYTGPFGTQWFNRVELFTFSDGNFYSWEDILPMVIAQHETAGNDTIYGFSYEDTFDGGAGDDFLSGGNENDTYVFGTGDGHDTIIEGATNILGGMDDTLEFKAGILPEDVTFHRDGESDDLLVTLASGDSVLIEGQFSAAGQVFGVLWFNRIENFKFDATGEIITAEDVIQNLLTSAKTPGDDPIYGFFREDVLDGGAGNDYLAGGSEGDTYIWGRGYNNDVVYDSNAGSANGANIDKVVFTADVASEDIAISRGVNLDDLVLTITDTGESLTVQSQFLAFASGPPHFQIEEFRFADGTVWGPDHFRPIIMAQQKTAGDDDIVGFNTSDVLDGGTGNDVLHGGGGGDTFIFGHGYGNDTVDANINIVSWDFPDTIQFNADVDVSDVQLARVNNNLILTLDSGEQLTILDQFDGLGYSRVENFHFADGTNWTWQDVQQAVFAASQTPGDDHVIGYASDDTLDGGAGNDLLQGGAGNDTYVFGRGYGRDTIDDNNLSVIGDAPDRVLFNADVALGDLTFLHIEDDLIIRINGTNDRLTVQDQWNPYLAISTFEFANGTVLTKEDVDTIISNNPADTVTHLGTDDAETLVGTSGNDVLDGLGGNDLLQGGLGNDIYFYRVGSGNDRIQESLGTDELRLVGLNASDVALTRVGDDVVVQIVASGETITVENQFFADNNGVEQIKFADGTVWDRSAIQDHAAIFGTSGADTITGTGASETFDGLGGNDTISGSTGSDTYIYGVGSGNDTINEYGYQAGTDTLRLVGLNAADLIFSRAGYDLLITINSSGETLKSFNHFHDPGNGIDRIEFADGTVWDSAQILSAVAIRGTAGNDTLTGSGGDDIFDGGPGNDTLNGSSGSDTYLYGVGSGNDTVNERYWEAGTDTARLIGLNAADVTFSRTTYDLLITINSSGETLNGYYQFHDAGNGIDQVQFADGTIWNSAQIASAAWYRGTSGADTLTGTGDSETFDGRGGNDTLNGSTGGDTYIFGVGSGNDTINESWWYSGSDTARLIGLNAADVTLTHAGYNLLITINSTGETLNAYYQFHDAGAGVEHVQFADGTIWDSAQIASAAWYRGTSGADTIYGDSANNTFYGGTGNDTLYDHSGGADTYVFASGDGSDTIDEQSGNAAEIDTLKLLNLNAGDIKLSRSGIQLYIDVNATGERIRDVDHFWANVRGVDQIMFADGTIWDRATITQNAWIRGTSSAETIYGTADSEQFYGAGSNDTLYDHSGGADTYIYASGDGSDIIDEQSNNAAEVDTLKLLNLNPADVTLSRSGIQLYIDINATGERIRDVDHFWANVRGIDQIVFSDGTVWDRATITQNAWIRGTSSGETINGTADSEPFYGAGGNDTLYDHAGGADTYIYASGDGNDTIDEQSNNAAEIDTLKLLDLDPTDVTLSRDGIQLYIDVTATGARIRDVDHFWAEVRGVDQIIFGDGTVWDRATIAQKAWIAGTSGNDTMSGGAGIEAFDGGLGNDTVNAAAGNDMLIGGAGNDTLSGGTGNDGFVFNSGFGQDIVTDFVAGAGSDDVIEFHDGIFADFNAVLAAASTSGSDTVITVDASNSIVLQNVAVANLHQDDFRFV